MRKTTLVAAGLVIGLSMGLAACGSKDTANQNTSKSTTAAVTTAESKSAAQAAGKESAQGSSEAPQGEQGEYRSVRAGSAKSGYTAGRG